MGFFGLFELTNAFSSTDRQPAFFSSSGARLTVVYDEVYPQQNDEEVKKENDDQKFTQPGPVPSEPEIECIDD